MIIQITNWNNTKSFRIRKLFSYDITKKLNDTGSLKVSFAIDIPGINNFEIKKGYLIQAYIPIDNFNTSCIFSGYIHEPTISDNRIDILAYDLVGYLKCRMLRVDKLYNTTVSSIISDLFNYLDGINELPVLLGKNDCSDIIQIELKKNTSFYDILNSIVEKVKDLQFRVVQKLDGNKWVNILDISKNTGQKLAGVWKRNYTDDNRNSSIISWSWKDKFDGFCNYLEDSNGVITEDNESIIENGLFERYEFSPDGANKVLNQSFVGLPSLDINTNYEDLTNIMIGDKKDISVITRLQWFAFSYEGIIQEINISSRGGQGINFSVKAGEDLVNDSNILDKTLKKYTNIIKNLTK